MSRNVASPARTVTAWNFPAKQTAYRPAISGPNSKPPSAPTDTLRLPGRIEIVVARPGRAIETEHLIVHCRSYLSAYKIPQTVHLIEQIPRTGSGKIMRYKLRQRLNELEVMP